MNLIQIFLPVRDNKKKAFSKDKYTRIRKALTKQFGGLTAYSRAPAEGLWKDERNDAHHDEIIIFEVMAAELDKRWWKKYKTWLERTFAQDEIIIRVQNVMLLE